MAVAAITIDNTGRKAPQIVSDQILWLRKGMGTTPMHVLKLVYLCHGWMLGRNKRALVYEQVEAWKYGPVIPSVYHTYKCFGGSQIEDAPVNRKWEFDGAQRRTIEFVHEVYGDLSAVQLSALTHRPGTPWDIVRKEKGLGSVIPNHVILRHYESLV